MKEIGNFLTIIGLLYASHKLIGTEPNVNGWWFHVGLGLLVYWIGAKIERAKKKQRDAELAARMQEYVDRQERWRKERGL